MKIPTLVRRQLLIGGGVGAGLVVGYALWPRVYLPNSAAAPGEHVLSAFIKVGEDGHVTVVVPQVELGHGVFTGLAQIVADELGADWRTVAVETAQGGAMYTNPLFMREWRAGLGGALIPARLATETMATGWSGSVRAFEGPLRTAAAGARALLCMAAAARWDADWEACDAWDGFVRRGDDRLRFGEVAREAAALTAPERVAWRMGDDNRLTARSLPRLDLPAKVDGSVNFAADIRLPDMVYAALASGPVGALRITGVDEAAARRVPGVVEVVRDEAWVAVVAANSWAAQQGLAAANVRWALPNPIADSNIAAVLDAALTGDGTRMYTVGDLDTAFRGAQIWRQDYASSAAPHGGIETASATARIEAGLLEVWLATQLPERAAAAAAEGANHPLSRTVVHPVQVGGSFGARTEVAIARQAAALTAKLGRPVQLTSSRAQETAHQPPRPPARVRMAARTAEDGRIAVLYARVASPATLHEIDARVFGGTSDAVAEPAAIHGAIPPYDIPIVAVDHCPVVIGLPTGDWRGRAAVHTVFAREAFIDEVAHMTGGEPFGIRMGMLGSNARLANCLTRAAATANWQGGTPGTGQGLALHVAHGSAIAVVAEARREGADIRVTRLVAVADVGRVINPDIVRAQIIGGLIFGIGVATAAALTVQANTIGPARFRDLRLPRLPDTPAIEVELIVSQADPGGVGELAVSSVAPAIAGALFAGSGVRYRKLPLTEPA